MAWVAALVLLTSLVGSANAETVAVPSNGSPALSKMVVTNGASAVVVKLCGVGGKANLRWSLVRLKGDDGVTYEAMVGWYSGGVWIKSLYRGSTEVTCGDYVYALNATGGFWRVSVARSCLGRLTNRLKASSEHVTNTSAAPGQAGWRPWVARG